MSKLAVETLHSPPRAGQWIGRRQVATGRGRKPVCGTLRAGHRAAALHSGSVDSAEFRCATGRIDSGSAAAAFAALVLYLAEGALGLPVFNPAGPGGVAQLLGPTGGYLMAYPFVAGLAGFVIGARTEDVRACRGSRLRRRIPAIRRRT